jgi:type IV pilus assembly protein PilQ
LEVLQNRLAPGATPPAVPTVQGAGNAGQGAFSGPAAAPAPDARPALPGEPKTKIVRRVTGEGDGRLSINLQDADIREVLEMLSAQGNLNILASNSVQGKVSATLNGVDLDSAMAAILRSTGYVARREGKFIYVGTPQDFDTMEQSLDRVGTRVYRPNYVAAAELQTLIQPLITPKVGVVSVSAPSEVGIGSDDAKTGGNAFAGGEVVLVRDYEAVLAEIDQIAQEVDVRPTQVAIEAMILSVKLTDSDKLGINWQLLRDKANLKLALGTPAETLPTSFTTGGISVAFMDGSLGAFLEALETINETNVIASPRLMVMNKQRAEIQIGRQQGYVSTTSQTETSTTATMQMLDTGTILRLRPFISADGLIRMEVHPELSSGEVQEKANTLVPDKEITQVTSNIMVRDGCTVIIGGLMREELKTTGNQVLVLGSLPLVGPLFRNRTNNTERHEILVLITPHIAYDPESCAEGDRAACEFHRRQAVVAEKMNPLNKFSISRRYLRLAQNAWACCDREKALRFAELAVHFDPMNRAAIDLRSDIWLGRPNAESAGGDTGAASPASLDQTIMSPWLLGELEREPAPAPVPMHPLDAGVPGTHRDIERPRRLP